MRTVGRHLGPWAAILDVTSQSEVNRVQGGEPNTMVAALLGADKWGGAAGLVSTHVQSFLAEIYRFLHPLCAPSVTPSVTRITRRQRREGPPMAFGLRRRRHFFLTFFFLLQL